MSSHPHAGYHNAYKMIICFRNRHVIPKMSDSAAWWCNTCPLTSTSMEAANRSALACDGWWRRPCCFFTPCTFPPPTCGILPLRCGILLSQLRLSCFIHKLKRFVITLHAIWLIYSVTTFACLYFLERLGQINSRHCWKRQSVKTKNLVISPGEPGRRFSHCLKQPVWANEWTKWTV